MNGGDSLDMQVQMQGLDRATLSRQPDLEWDTSGDNLSLEGETINLRDLTSRAIDLSFKLQNSVAEAKELQKEMDQTVLESFEPLLISSPMSPQICFDNPLTLNRQSGRARTQTEFYQA